MVSLKDIKFTPRQRIQKLSTIASTISLSLLTACGGGGSSYSPSGSIDVPTTPIGTTLPTSASLKNLCLAPRANTEDRSGTIVQEKAYLRSFVDETYLWYKDVPTLDPAIYTTPQKYFLDLKTTKKTASGRALDEFHWSVTQEEYDAQEVGIEEGYGVDWARAASSPPRDWVVANTEPVSPVGGIFKRGDKLMSVDGEDFIKGSDVNKINEGLFPSKVAPHTFELMRGTQKMSFTITPAMVTSTPVRYAKVITTPTGKVGYVYFDAHIAKSEAMLITAFRTLKDQGAQELVLDLRYNGGGLISVASRLAYMVGGNNTTGKTFDNLVYNDKMSNENYAFPFYTNASNAAGGAALPTLNLKKVTVLTGKGTASASEAIINGLRGVDVDVTLIGETTRGKPYGFVPQGNCGWVYYTVQFKGENHKGFGDFADGFPATCTVKDDFAKDLGDVAEGRFAAALNYRETKQCPAPTGSVSSLKSVGEGPHYVVTPKPSKELLIPR